MSDIGEMSEVQTMRKCIPSLFQSVLRYASHRVRANVQFDAIAKVKEKMRFNDTMILIVLDHKQKILPQKYREGQVEYFGKKG